MINWAEYDEDFLAFTKDLQSRYDGKGSFRSPDEMSVTNDDAEAATEAAAEGELDTVGAGTDANAADNATTAGSANGSILGASPSTPVCENLYAKVELTVSTGEPTPPSGGLPVRFEFGKGTALGWAIGWLPSCSITESDGLSETELAFAAAYLKANALAIMESHFASA